MNKNDEDYIKIQLKVDNEKRRHLDKTKKIISSTEYAKIHLKENLDWYKIKYKDIVSSRRNHQELIIFILQFHLMMQLEGNYFLVIIILVQIIFK